MILTTIKDVYLALLIELNKQESPTILLEDFNYLYNKAKQNYINKRINISPIGQQVIDDLAEITVFGRALTVISINANTYPKQYKVDLPEDYLHLLRCNPEVTTQTVQEESCPTPVGNISYPITKPVTSKELSEIGNNYYLKPSFKLIYYGVNQVDRQYKLNLYCGNDTNKHISKVFVDYFRVPKTITLNEDDLYEVDDNSTILEFKPYVNQEILNELVSLVMENAIDPRLVTNKQVNQTIGLPQMLQAQQ